MGKNVSIGPDVDAQEIFGPLNETGTPERNLLMAILVRAILDFVGNDKKEALSAQEWLSQEDTEGEEVFTFAWICNQLDLDHKTIQSRIFAMPKRGEHRVAPWYFMREEHASRVVAKKKAKLSQFAKHRLEYSTGSTRNDERMVACPS
jgi:hypothetical protein